MTTEVISEAMHHADFFARYALELGAHDAYLFGSVARQGDGNDIDMIIVVEKPLADAFEAIIEFRRSQNPWRMEYGGQRELRQRAAFLMLDVHEPHLPKLKATGKPPFYDLFLFPPDWQNEIDRLERVYRSEDGHFIARIKAESRNYYHGFEGREYRHGFMPLDEEAVKNAPQWEHKSRSW